MRRLLFFIILVIVLVSLNWFMETRANDLHSLSAQQQALLLKNQQASSTTGNGGYTSQPIYGADHATETPNPVDLTRQSRPLDQLTFEELQPFGAELFAGPSEMTPPEDIASADDYLLGPGDNIIISMWGRVEQEYNLTVDREGKCFVPQVGELIAWGKTLDQFRAYARRAFGEIYAECDVNVSLGRIRSIRIYLTGEVRRPGAYTISSLTSLFNALYLAGGPTEQGSMRAIRLMRRGELVTAVDLYKFLLQGDNSLDVRLESGDAIFVPVAAAQVAIRGEINRPAIYELTGTETAEDLLKLAGNPTAEAHLDRVMLERISSRKEWEVIDLNLNPAARQSSANTKLIDGDRMTVFSIFEERTNMVAVAGKVKHPGYYERTDTTRISELLSRGQLQEYDVYLDKAALFRHYADNRTAVIPIDLKKVLAKDPTVDILLTDRDSLYVYSLQEVDREKYVYISGETRKPGRSPLDDNMTIEDLVFLAGSFTRSASRLRGELAHTDSLGTVTLEYIQFDDDDALRRPLTEDDRLYVRQIPEWELHRTVQIDGEVQYPGEYVLASKDETLYQLLSRTGGFTAHAFPRGLIFERQSIAATLDRQQIPRLMEKSAPIITDSMGYEVQRNQVEFDPTSVTRLIINVERIMATQGRDGDIVLNPGDKIFVPSLPSGITVLGEVGAGGTIKYADDKNVSYYINRAGNFVPSSDKNGLRLFKADGQVFSGKGTLNRRVDIGDIIVVPKRIEKDRDWLKSASNAVGVAAGALTTVLLIDRL